MECTKLNIPNDLFGGNHIYYPLSSGSFRGLIWTIFLIFKSRCHQFKLYRRKGDVPKFKFRSTSEIVVQWTEIILFGILFRFWVRFGWSGRKFEMFSILYDLRVDTIRNDYVIETLLLAVTQWLNQWPEPWLQFSMSKFSHYWPFTCNFLQKNVTWEYICWRTLLYLLC